MPPDRVSGTPQASGRDMPVIANRPRKRRRLVNLKNKARGPNAGAPPSDSLNLYPFPFQGIWQPARHGHHPVFKVGQARRVGAWRTAATGTLGGNHQRAKKYR
jgi:hypothetical protein